MQIFTMGFTQKSAEVFFNLIREHKIEILVDIRLNNQSQLAGFTKGKDLSFLLNEICDCKYSHEEQFAPTKDILDGYKKGKLTWEQYESEYNKLIRKRNVVEIFKNKYHKYENILLLCSEPTPECCHRRLLAEYLCNELKHTVVHI